MAIQHNASLTIGDSGVECDVWDQYTLSLSMLRAGQPWTFSLWRSRDRRAAWDVLTRTVKLFDRVTVSIDGHPQLTGRIELIERRASGHGECAMILSGRDLAGPAQSWDADPTVSIKDTPLEDALTAIFDPLGLTVRVTAAAAARSVQSARAPGARSPATSRRRNFVDRAHPRPGEKVWSLAESMVKRLGYMLWCAPRTDGTVGLVVDVPDYNQEPAYTLTRRLDALGMGSGNILDGTESLSVREVPTDVAVYTGTPRGAATSARSRTQVVNAALFDDRVTRGFVSATTQAQPRHMRSERARTIDAAQKEAERAIAEGMQGFYRYTARVQGHAQEAGGAMRLYAVNTVARVHDDLFADAQGRPLDAALYVTDVEMTGSRAQGQATTLTMVPLHSIRVTPET